jgi:radical SAM superfamily enzyme YgiQ (UPF0313 family)
MTKKIIIVSANQLTIPYPVYPLGVSYIATYLRKKLPQFKIKIFDFIDKNYADFVQLLETFQPDYTCISLRNIDDVNIYKQESYIGHYKSIVDYTRKSGSSKIIVGGAGFSIFPELLFNTVNPDFGIAGEGEEKLFQLITFLENNTDHSAISNLIYRNANKVVFNKEVISVKNLYLNFEPGLLDYYWQKSGMLNIQTKRGCPYHCVYCTYPLIEGREVRTLDIDIIIDTLIDLSKNKNIDYVFFTDSIFNIDTDFNKELSEKIIRNNIKIKWGAYFNFCNLDEEILRLNQRAGLSHIEFGTESLSDTMLKNYRKPFNVSDILKISEICVNLQIDFAHFLILGGNGETDDTINETFENSMKIGKTAFFPFIGMRIYPGTELYKIALKEKVIDASNDLLAPAYYVSDKFDLSSLKEKAAKTAKRWIFPDDDHSAILSKMRLKNKKGPLWEYLTR